MGTNQALMLDPFKIKKINRSLGKVVQEVDSGGDINLWWGRGS